MNLVMPALLTWVMVQRHGFHRNILEDDATSHFSSAPSCGIWRPDGVKIDPGPILTDPPRFPCPRRSCRNRCCGRRRDTITTTRAYWSGRGSQILDHRPVGQNGLQLYLGGDTSLIGDPLDGVDSDD